MNSQRKQDTGSDLSRLYGRVPAETRIPSEQRVYCNRNLRLASVGAIGFDLDHTLVHYKGPQLEELTYVLTRERLLARFGYPETLLQVPYEREFVIRGLVVDRRRGNILKMDYHNYVTRAYHGRRLLDPEERKKSYRTGRVRMGGGTYVSVDTLFHLPEVFLFAVLVDMLDKGQLSPGVTPRKIYSDVREAIDSVHGDGTLKKKILGNIGRYVRHDPRLFHALEEFRVAGKKLFLLTNSEWYYTDALMGYLRGRRGRSRKADWLDAFDLVIADAGKPDFFTDLRRPETERARPRTGGPEVIHGGNARQLEGALGFAGDAVLYFGDHTYGDILRSKKTLGWRTAMLVEELEDEIAATRRVQPQLDELNHWTALRGLLEADLSALVRKKSRAERRIEEPRVDEVEVRSLKRTLAKLRRRQTALEDELAGVQDMTRELGGKVQAAYNTYWGPLFREGGETSRFGHQVKDFACLYTTRVSNFLNYNPSHYFRSPRERLPHDLD